MNKFYLFAFTGWYEDWHFVDEEYPNSRRGEKRLKKRIKELREKDDYDIYVIYGEDITKKFIVCGEES